MRIFTKRGWQYDTDCRIEKTDGRAALVIAPPLPPLPPYSREPGHGRPRPKATPGAFRKAYLGKAVRWMKRWAERNRVRR